MTHTTLILTDRLNQLEAKAGMFDELAKAVVEYSEAVPYAKENFSRYMSAGKALQNIIDRANQLTKGE